MCTVLSCHSFNPLDLDKYGRNVIHYAAKGGQIETLKYFIEEKGYDPISQGRDGWTTLHIAAQFNQLEVVEYLIFEHMANVSCRTKSGSILHCIRRLQEAIFTLYNS